MSDESILINKNEIDDIVESIKKKFQQHRENFELLSGEIVNCARQVKIWLMLSEIKRTNDVIAFEAFWGWLQQKCLLRQIVIDSYKLLKDAQDYLSSTLRKIIEKEQIGLLMQYSEISGRLKKFRKIVEPFKEFRNKRFAHIEDELVPQAQCHMLELFDALADLEISLRYIRNVLLNPIYIVSNNYPLKDCYQSSNNSPFNDYFEFDPAIKDLEKILA